MNAWLRRLLLVCLFVCCSPVVAESIRLGPGVEQVVLAGHIAVLAEAKNQPLSLQEARAADLQGAFRPLAANLGAGYKSPPYWLRFEVEQASVGPAEWRLEVEPPYLDDIRFYAPDAGRVYHMSQGGDWFPFSQRQIVHRNAVFPVSLPPGRSVLYLRVQTTSTMAVIPRLWRPQAFALAAQREYLGWGFYFGILLSVALFGFLNGLFSRRPAYFRYVFYVLTVIFSVGAMAGFVSQFMFPDAPRWANCMVGVGVGINTLATSMLFSWLFQARQHYRWLYEIYRVGMVLGGVTALAALTPWYGYVAALLMPCMASTCLLTLKPAFDYLRTPGDSERRWLGAAFILFCMLIHINIANAVGMVSPSIIGLYGFWVGCALFLLALYVGALVLMRKSERREAAAQQQAREAEHQAELERRSKEEREHFLAMFNHEVRTPLAIVRASAQSLEVLDRQPDPARQSRYGNIFDAVDRTQKLIELCLTADRLDTGDWAAPVPCDLVAATDETLARLGLDARARLQITAPPQALIAGDPELLRIVLRNLIDNACKYATPDSGIDIAITPTPGAPGFDWSVVNHGQLWADGDEERLFEKYFRAGEHQGHAGLGLGLFLVRRIMAIYGGTVHAEVAGASRARFRCRFQLGGEHGAAA